VSMGMNAALKTKQILENARGVLGIELMAATQALDFRTFTPGRDPRREGGRPRHVEHLDTDRPLSRTTTRMMGAVERCEILDARRGGRRAARRVLVDHGGANSRGAPRRTRRRASPWHVARTRRWRPSSESIAGGSLKTVGVAGAVAAGRVVLGVPAFAEETPPLPSPPPTSKRTSPTSEGAEGAPRDPGPFPGKVVAVQDARCLEDEKVDGKVVAEMFERGITALTGKSMKKSFSLLFDKRDVVGIKVNPVGAPLIHVKPELAER